MKIATAPVNWNNTDVPDIRPPIPFYQMLTEMRDAGYTATEFGPGMPWDNDLLRATLDAHGLQLVGAFFATSFAFPGQLGGDWASFVRLCTLLRGCGAEVVVLSDAVTPERSQYAGRSTMRECPRLDSARQRMFVEQLEKTATYAADHGLQVVFHHHVGSYVENPEEIQWLMQQTNPELLGLCLDTGHLVYGGGNCIDVIRTYGSRIRYVHIKDVDVTLRDKLVIEGASFQDALRRYIFPSLGEGGVDIAGVISELRAIAYSGWLVVEQDTQPTTAFDAAKKNLEYLRKVLSEVE